MTYPPLVPVADLAGLDYFDNFPHLVSLAAPLVPARPPTDPMTGVPADGAAEGAVSVPVDVAADGTIPPAALAPAALALPSATCYSVYLDLRGRVLGQEPVRVTTVTTCFRREAKYEGLRRMFGFRMREIVCVGTRDAVLGHLAEFKTRILRFTERIGLPVTVEAATDPFFDPNGARTLMQKLFPVKEEFLFGGDLAIASVNFHRNFFGEKCRIGLPDGSPAFTGCVAFGIERWLAALGEHFGGDAAVVDTSLRTADDRPG
jgi:seryl-tRNA synthetase